MNLPKPYSVVFAAGAQSSTVDLKACYRTVYLQTPVFASGGTFYVQGSLDGTNFFRFYQDFTASGAATIFQIAQTASQALIPIPAGVQHYKIENTSGISNGATFNLICFD
jgi:hypothetical protein